MGVPARRSVQVSKCPSLNIISEVCAEMCSRLISAVYVGKLSESEDNGERRVSTGIVGLAHIGAVRNVCVLR
jgi:hypothetical protein